jgi:hypothetical protein
MVSLYVFAHDILLIFLSFNSERGSGQYTETRGVKDTDRKENVDCGGTSIGIEVVKKERKTDRKRSGQKR